MSKKIYKETYFQHDRYARRDPKIRSMLAHFRKESELKAQAAICIFWWIVEDMHVEDYPIDKIEVFADDYRCDVDFLKSILEDFELFRKDKDCYISDRILRNIEEQKKISEQKRKAAGVRWKNKDKNKEGMLPDAQEAGNEIDTEFVNAVIQIFNSEFKRTQIVGKENRERIDKITKDNNLTLEIWQAVFGNAKRGWDIKGEHKKPNLKNILDKWDLFASDDYFLAPDYESLEKEKKEKEAQEARLKEEERIKSEKEAQEMQKCRDGICDAKSAIFYLNKYWKVSEESLKNLKTVKDYMQQYNFSVKDILAAREEVQNG